MKRNVVSFDGPGPFDLFPVRNVAVTRRGRAVVFSFEVQMPSSQAAVVRIAVSSNQAQRVATEIRAVAKTIGAVRKLPTSKRQSSSRP